MLDFSKLLHQIEEIESDSLIDAAKKEVLGEALEAYERALTSADGFSARLAENIGWAWWPVCTPMEDIASKYRIEMEAPHLTVVGVDGSQIMPSHHEVYNCYLLNIGLAVISYGEKASAELTSTPKLYHHLHELYPLVDRRRMRIDELHISLERNLLELRSLSEAAIKATERGLPVVAMFDGSLISWSVEKMPFSYQESYHQRVLLALRPLHENKIPIIGYLSRSRAVDVVNALRVFICPYETSHCRENCAQLNEEDFPCSKISPLSDSQIFSQRLDFNSRSPVFMSGAGVTQYLPQDERVLFCYVNVGSEVARLEFPRWVFEDKAVFEMAISGVMAQAKKGMGYPICLSEAHHQAVIKGFDREQFFLLLTRRLIELGMPERNVSPKESGKRIGFV
jgi:hypothetical protein